jgi:hypothetical protein
MNPPSDRVVSYAPPGPVIRKFFQSQAFFRGIRGPLGSGKSTACVAEILRRAQLQAPSPDGVRRTRWAVIRNSYPELRTTTLETWKQWCPATYGKITYDSPIRHFVQTPTMEFEVLFMALDREDDVRKLLSLELTGGWINEAREIPKAIVDALTGRVGRFPSKIQGGCTWSGIFADTNPPDDQSWWYNLETDCPEGWEFFTQPSGLSPEAENVQNLPDGYYARLIAGKDPDWVKVYLHGEFGFVIEGKPVYPMYRDRIHAATEVIRPIPELPLLIGQDFGLTPAAVLGQKLADGRWLILDELTADGCGIERFSELLRGYIATNYPEFDTHTIEHLGWADPAGNHKAETDERCALEILKANTQNLIRWQAAPTNEYETRREVVVSCLNRLVDGNPGLLISPKCKMLRKGFASGYHYKIIKTGNGSQVHDKPAKNEYSHPHDALQYLLLGAGEYQVVAKKKSKSKGAPTRMAKDVDYDMFGR